MSTLSFDRDQVAAVLRTVLPVVEQRNTIQILGYVLLHAEQGRLRVTATDLDLYLEVACAAEGEVDAALPAATFAAAVNGLRAGEIKLVIDKGRAVLKQGRATRTMGVLPSADFPPIRLPEDAKPIEVTAAGLRRALGAVSHAQADDPARPYLEGVYLHGESGNLVAVALDGYAIARCVLGSIAGVDEVPGVIVSTKTVKVLAALVDRGEGMAGLQIAPDKLLASVGDVRLVAKLVEGTYPDYQRLIPEKAPNELLVDAAELARAEASVASTIAAEKRSRKLRFVLNAERATDVFASDVSGNEAVEPLEANYFGIEHALALNGRYVAGFARMFSGASLLSLSFREPGSPLLVVSEAEPDLTGLIMPMAI